MSKKKMRGTIEVVTVMDEVIAVQDFTDKNTYEVTLVNMQTLFPNHNLRIIFQSTKW